MENKKISIRILLVVSVLTLSIFYTNLTSAITIPLGKEKNLDVELSPPKSLFNTEEDGYFYPGSPKITKNLKVINIGDLPFRICRFNATFYEDIQLAEVLQIEILELGGEEPHLLYTGTLSSLQEGVEAVGKRAIPPRKSTTLKITVWMPEKVENEYQGLSMIADIAVTVRFEPKS